MNRGCKTSKTKTKTAAQRERGKVQGRVTDEKILGYSLGGAHRSIWCQHELGIARDLHVPGPSRAK